MNELLHSLHSNLVFRSYLSNTFILNEINQLTRDMENGVRTQDDMNRTVDSIMQTVGMFIPQFLLQSESLIDHENFIKTVADVKYSSLQNLLERRKN